MIRPAFDRVTVEFVFTAEGEPHFRDSAANLAHGHNRLTTPQALAVIGPIVAGYLRGSAEVSAVRE